MASEEPIEVVPINKWGIAVGVTTLVALFMGVMGGAFGSEPVSETLGVELVVGGAIAFLVTTVAVLAVPVLAKVGQETRFYDDRVELTGGVLRILGGSSAYDDVELVIRKSRVGDKVFGTATFELLKHGDNVLLPYVSDPDAVERLLTERVAPPERQLRREREGYDHTYFWRHWNAEDPVPEEPVVDQGELEDILDVDLGDVDMDALDEAEDLADFDDLGDLGDVAGDFGSGADGGGDGGGGGE